MACTHNHSTSPSWLRLSKRSCSTPRSAQSTVAPLDSAVIAKSLRQVALRPTGTGHPEDRINKASLVASAALAAAATWHQGRKPVPLGFINGIALFIHGWSPLNIYLESDLHPFGVNLPSSAFGFTNNTTLLNDFQKTLMLNCHRNPIWHMRRQLPRIHPACLNSYLATIGR
ncbi:hypothetical protein IE4872_PD02087 (plasmid) [Rhizobium gallicum]|uniref:Uncharacterized protein n=1 Tax=Rhizobium gallicum TaxID=56730 RepID=A0A1L5NXI0_9HYPH|nr:hypothetical protein IE4872_PD02087 [Rhizobium gallicum]